MKKGIIYILLAAAVSMAAALPSDAQVGKRWYINAGWQFNATPGNEYVIIGLLSTFRSFFTKAGKEMASGVMEDYTGSIEVVFFPKTWKAIKEKSLLLHQDQIYGFRGKVDKKDGRIQFIVDSQVDMQDVKKSLFPLIVLRLR